ncbi:MAG: hypothetical protein LBC88_06525 [Spirochaetaceae bacterium]|jgi:hypothetical protein|nr:hypothetical protein [Spirochaetaceae bacterium]
MQGIVQTLFRRSRSFRLRMLLSIAGIFFLLVLSAWYILFSGRHLQSVAAQSFERERFFKIAQADLDAIHLSFEHYLAAPTPAAREEIQDAAVLFRGNFPPPPRIYAHKWIAGPRVSE